MTSILLVGASDASGQNKFPHFHSTTQRTKKGGGDFYRTQDVRLGRRFASFLVRAVREGRIQYRDAYRLTDLKGETFNHYAELVLQRMKNERQ